MKDVFIALVIGYIVFELIEHVIFPLFWYIKNRKRRSVSGAAGMSGKVGEVRNWQEGKGKIFVNGELWSAVSDDLLFKGDKAVIQDVEGLVLRVRAVKR